MPKKTRDTYSFCRTYIAYHLPDGTRKQMICFARNDFIELCFQETLGM